MTKKKTSQTKTRDDRKLLEMECLTDEMRELLNAKLNMVNDVKEIEDLPVKQDFDENISMDETKIEDSSNENKTVFPKFDDLTIVFKRLPTRD